MAIILGLDVSTCTGYAVWDAPRHISSIETGVIEVPEAKKLPNSKKHDYHWDDWRAAQMGPKIRDLLRQVKPDFVLIEERMRYSKTGDASFAMTNALHGAIYSHCCTMGFLFGTIPTQSWRQVVYGEKFDHPLIPDMARGGVQKRHPETGALLFKEKDWGDIAVDKCSELGIIVPSKKGIAHNAAEAALIAMVWRCHKRIYIPEKRAVDKYIALREQRSERQAASSLFMGEAA